MSSETMRELLAISMLKGARIVACLDLFMLGIDALAFFAVRGKWSECLVNFFHSRNIGKKINNFIYYFLFLSN